MNILNSERQILISVIVPTYNRCKFLNTCLSSLLQQTFPKDRYEIILVDNNSTDQTFQTVEEINNKSEKKVIYIKEEKKGLIYARHKGASIAKGIILAYTDDDAICHSDWLLEISKSYDDDSVGCAGGKILPKWEKEPPNWIKQFPLSFLSLLDYGNEVIEIKPIPGEEFVKEIYGVNFSIKRDLLFLLGGFDPDPFCDRVGDGEVGLIYKIIRKTSYRVIYNPKMIIWHFIPASRLNIEFVKERFSRIGSEFSYYDFRLKRRSKASLFCNSLFFCVTAAFNKLLAIKGRILAKDYFYGREAKAAFFKSRSLFELRLIFDKELQEFVLKENWLD